MTMRWRCHPASGELRAEKDRPRFFTGRVPLPNTEGPVMSLTGVEEVLQKCAKIEKLFFFSFWCRGNPSSDTSGPRACGGLSPHPGASHSGTPAGSLPGGGVRPHRLGAQTRKTAPSFLQLQPHASLGHHG